MCILRFVSQSFRVQSCVNTAACPPLIYLLTQTSVPVLSISAHLTLSHVIHQPNFFFLLPSAPSGINSSTAKLLSGQNADSNGVFCLTQLSR